MSKKIAPTLQLTVRNALGPTGDLYEERAWEAMDRELRALLAVERAVRKEHQFCPTFEKCPTCSALARLDRLSSGTGKRKGGSRG